MCNGERHKDNLDVFISKAVSLLIRERAFLYHHSHSVLSHVDALRCCVGGARCHSYVALSHRRLNKKI